MIEDEVEPCQPDCKLCEINDRIDTHTTTCSTCVAWLADDAFVMADFAPGAKYHCTSYNALTDERSKISEDNING